MSWNEAIRAEQCHTCKVWQDVVDMSWDGLNLVWYCSTHAPFVDWQWQFDVYPVFKRHSA